MENRDKQPNDNYQQNHRHDKHNATHIQLKWTTHSEIIMQLNMQTKKANQTSKCTKQIQKMQFNTKRRIKTRSQLTATNKHKLKNTQTTETMDTIINKKIIT